jgi:hypothetical protein
MKHLAFTIILLFSFFLSFAQLAPDKYWVKFTDKTNTPYSIENPEDFLSQKAIDRRTNQGIAIEENDLPVDPAYIQAVINEGAEILTVSKWFNSVTVYATSSSVINAIELLPFVLSVEKDNLGNAPSNEESVKPFFENEWEEEIVNTNLKGISSGSSYDYGSAFNQIDMLNGIALHDAGYDGSGMTIAVLDAGFLNADVIDGFDSLWINGQILGFKDFVEPASPDIFGSHYHGTMVLSTMGAYLPTEMVGTAPKADYWLLRSEDGGTEYLIEEINWVSAAEFADSVGVDIINSSLGYTTFDDASQDHTYANMDGNTTPITIGADIAASKGILVVNSAGNEGNSSWHYIGAPADGNEVFTIGAVNSSGNYASFSSTGPTYDGRVKPNVVAQGQGSTVISAYSGNITTGSGTSFSSPITAGMVACLWQAHPDKTNFEIMTAIEESASLASNPNNQLGYGIPDYLEAHNQLSIPTIYEINIDIEIFLEGPFNGTTMNPAINNILPLNQPFNVPPFNYSGSESVVTIPSSEIVDWVLIELRDANSPSQATEITTVSKKAVFLKSDGSITDLDGLSFPTFNLAVSDSIFVIVWHRNHLAAMSSTALKNVGSNIYPFDFTTSADQVYGNALGFKEISPGIFGMVAGDGNSDGNIDDLDKEFYWSIKAGNAEYHSGDYNLDGQIDNTDKDIFWLTNTIYVRQIPE